MIDLFRHRTTVVWALLVLATVVSWTLGVEAGTGVQAGIVIVLLIAFTKVRYVGLEFMGLREANPILRGLFETWVVVVGGVVIGLYLIGH